MKRFTRALLTGAMAIAAAGLVETAAMATDGMFPNGIGARNKALAGAGVADSRDATAGAINPAGLVHVKNQFVMSGSLFSPWRDYKSLDNNQGFAPTKNVSSGSNYFLIPNMALSYRVDTPMVDVIGFSVVGSGGMNTDYTNVSRTSPYCRGGSGVLCGGNLGINLEQMGISIDFAKEIMPGVSVGFLLFSPDLHWKSKASVHLDHFQMMRPTCQTREQMSLGDMAFEAASKSN